MNENSCPLMRWNDRQERMLFSPTIGAAIAAGYWFLWVRAVDVIAAIAKGAL